MAASGRFIYYDLMTTDLEQTIGFLSGLLDYDVIGMEVADEVHYLMAAAKGEEEPIFGLIPIEAEGNARSHWIGYLAVDDVEDAIDAVRELGGEVHVSPDEVDDGPTGFAIVTDAQGVVFAPNLAKEGLPEAPSPTPLHRIGWVELMTSDQDAAAAFYSRVAGWEIGAAATDPGAGVHRTLSRDGQVFGIMRDLLPGSPIRPHFSYYIRVADLDATVARVKELGGFIYEDPAPYDGARRALVMDPTGAPIPLIQAE